MTKVSASGHGDERAPGDRHAKRTATLRTKKHVTMAREALAALRSVTPLADEELRRLEGMLERFGVWAHGIYRAVLKLNEVDPIAAHAKALHLRESFAFIRELHGLDPAIAIVKLAKDAADAFPEEMPLDLVERYVIDEVEDGIVPGIAARLAVGDRPDGNGQAVIGIAVRRFRDGAIEEALHILHELFTEAELGVDVRGFAAFRRAAYRAMKLG